jgi:hypothetical protein
VTTSVVVDTAEVRLTSVGLSSVEDDMDVETLRLALVAELVESSWP